MRSRNFTCAALLSIVFVGACLLFLGGLPRTVTSGERTQAPDPTHGAGMVSPALKELDTLAGLVARDMGGMRGAMARDLLRKRIDATWTHEDLSTRAAILTALASGDPDLQWVALVASDRYSPVDIRFIAAVLRQTDPQSPTRDVALETLLRFQSVDPDALGVLQAACATAEDLEVRAVLLKAVGIHGAGETTLALLLQQLRHGDARVRRGAAFGLASLRALPELTSDDLVDHLRSALGDPDAQVRAYASRSLQTLGSRAADAARALVRLLDDEHGVVVRWATSALVSCGEEALAPVAAAMQKEKSDPATLVWILRRIGGPQAMATLRSGLAHENAHMRAECAIALLNMGAKKAEVADNLVTMLDGADPEVLLLAMDGLRMAGVYPTASKDKVRELRGHRDPRVRDAASRLIAVLERK